MEVKKCAIPLQATIESAFSPSNAPRSHRNTPSTLNKTRYAIYLNNAIAGCPHRRFVRLERTTTEQQPPIRAPNQQRPTIATPSSAPHNTGTQIISAGADPNFENNAFSPFFRAIEARSSVYQMSNVPTMLALFIASRVCLVFGTR